jgi:hypothetical protein
MLTPYGHLTYCTNIHAGESWPDHFSAIRQHFPPVKQRLSPGAAMGLGLRLSNEASLALAEKENLRIFREWLAAENVYVFTMNGFPYGGFHHTRVKDQVHAPDWTTNDRVQYTIRLFNILDELLPANMDGGISTSPLSYRGWFHTAEALEAARKSATANILAVVEHLARLKSASGRLLHLDIEPEPDGLIETIREFIEWYEEDLLPAGIPYLVQALEISASEAASLILTHVRLCYDVCHAAIGYEDHAEMLRKLELAGILVGKIQISAALKAVLPASLEERLPVTESFRRFDEPVYLHQVVARAGDGSFIRYPDLPQALQDAANPSVKEWRAHFHVPVFREDFELLQSTQQDISQVLSIHKNKPFTNHLEVETYTWEVLPAELKSSLLSSIIREMEWVNSLIKGA